MFCLPHRDNEKPPRKVEVHGFKAKGRAITNEEVCMVYMMSGFSEKMLLFFKTNALSNKYARYMHENKVTKLPASWADEETPEPRDGTTGGINGHSTTTTSNGTNGHVNNNNNNCNNSDQPKSKYTTAVPASFLEGKSVRTVWGLVPLSHALDWPVFASYDELAGCAAWMGGRIPTLEEARCIYRYVDRLRRKEAEHQLGKTVPAVNA